MSTEIERNSLPSIVYENGIRARFGISVTLVSTNGKIVVQSFDCFADAIDFADTTANSPAQEGYQHHYRWARINDTESFRCFFFPHTAIVSRIGFEPGALAEEHYPEHAIKYQVIIRDQRGRRLHTALLDDDDCLEACAYAERWMRDSR